MLLTPVRHHSRVLLFVASELYQPEINHRQVYTQPDKKYQMTTRVIIIHGSKTIVAHEHICGKKYGSNVFILNTVVVMFQSTGGIIDL